MNLPFCYEGAQTTEPTDFSASSPAKCVVGNRRQGFGQLDFSREEGGHHCGAAGVGGEAFDRRGLPQARDQHGDVLRLEGQVRRMDVSEAKRLKQLEDENAKLKRLLADAMLNDAALKDLNIKKF